MASTDVAIDMLLLGGFELPTPGLPAERANNVPWQHLYEGNVVIVY